MFDSFVNNLSKIFLSRTYENLLELRVPRVQVKRRPSAAGLLPAPTQMALCLRLAYIDFKGRWKREKWGVGKKSNVR